MTNLYPHQKKGIWFLTKRKRAYLADDMGLGKTLQAILAADIIIEDHHIEKVLVICPAHLRKNWQNEIEKWSEHSKNFSILPYTQLHKLQEIPELIIFDEAHFLKNIKTKRTKQASLICEYIRKENGWVWLLSGTPVTKDITDYYSQLRLLDAIPRRKTDNKPWGFYGWCEALMFQEFDPWNYRKVKYYGINDQQKLAMILHPFFLRRRKDEELSLPDKVYERVMLDFTLPHGVMHQINKFDFDNVEKARMDESFLAARRIVGIRKAEKSIPYIKSLINECEANEPIVVFAHHKDVIDILVEGLREQLKFRRIEKIDGRTKASSKAQIVEEFQEGKISVLVASILACGTGFTLTKANLCVFVESDWSPANNHQASDRLHRIGQEHRVCCVLIESSHKVDNRINDLLHEKQVVFTKGVDEIR